LGNLNRGKDEQASVHPEKEFVHLSGLVWKREVINE
jgi:hypothetical protein